MKTVTDFKKMKHNNDPIVMITAYDFPSAKLAEKANVDMILVGDSLGMVVLGYDSTIAVTVDDMIHHTKAARRGAINTYIVTDMPFMSYHVSIADALINAKRIMQEGNANAVKVEGADDVIEVIKKLTASGVPVVGHLGLTPQSVGVLGGYKVQGKDYEAAKKLIKDANKIQEAGAIALVLECVPHQLAKLVTDTISIPTIGIGAGVDTDGQVLVFHDLIGFGVDRLPKFVKKYTDVQSSIVEAIEEYSNEVRNSNFPTEKHSFTMKEDELDALYGGSKK
ncbi:MAG: 3-methyl-2-oxobutanoate hydroxymethyltransferase [Bacillales bacterium]|jgi:3-methyl-2-oxobutanoate hydroxymethyltransferase|nr:3-methyl-2-oxobutanoate hydroxymethyltransferase [Bacillales bacterium]